MLAGVALVGCFVAAATYKLAAPATGADNPVRDTIVASAKQVRTTPTPAAFGQGFVRALNLYAVSRGDASRLASPHCIEASRGHYMCAYVLVRPGGTRECHLMQATWTPRHPVTVLRAGRVTRCDTVRAAVRSLP
jgi:hypothetical protein